MRTTCLLVCLELLVLGYVGFICRRILKNSFLANVFQIMAVLMGVLVSWLVQVSADYVVRMFVTNFVTRFVIVFGLSLIAFMAVTHFIQKNISLRDEQAKGVGPLFLKMMGKILNCGLILMLLVAVIILADFMVNLADLSSMRDMVRNNSLISRFLVRAPEAVTNDTPAEAAIDDQTRLISGLRESFDKSRAFLAENTGTQETLERISALMALLNLSVEETEWLVETTPALKELKDNEALTAVMEDDHIMDLVMEAGQGSMKAVYALGDEPGIRQIIEDPVIAKHIKMLDLREMREAALNYRRRNETVLPVIWHVASISFPHEMDAALTNAEMWTSVNATDEYCEWNDDTTFALVRAAFVVHAPIRVLTCCETEGTPTQWINDKKTAFKEHGGRRQAEVVLENGTTEIVVLIDFRKVKPPKICSVYVVLESGSR